MPDPFFLCMYRKGETAEEEQNVFKKILAVFYPL